MGVVAVLARHRTSGSRDSNNPVPFISTSSDLASGAPVARAIPPHPRPLSYPDLTKVSASRFKDVQRPLHLCPGSPLAFSPGGAPLVEKSISETSQKCSSRKAFFFFPEEPENLSVCLNPNIYFS